MQLLQNIHAEYLILLTFLIMNLTDLSGQLQVKQIKNSILSSLSCQFIEMSKSPVTNNCFTQTSRKSFLAMFIQDDSTFKLNHLLVFTYFNNSFRKISYPFTLLITIRNTLFCHFHRNVKFTGKFSNLFKSCTQLAQ